MDAAIARLSGFWWLVAAALLVGSTGIVSIIFGEAMVDTIGIYPIAFGLLLLFAAARLRNLHWHQRRERPRPSGEVARSPG